jgi:hypothetical protein
MKPDELQEVESQRQALVGQLNAAESALRACLRALAFDHIARAHLERARAHICEAHIAINEGKAIRSVRQLVEVLNRVKRVVAGGQRRKSQHI